MQRAANAPPATATTPRTPSTATSAPSTSGTPDLIKRFHLDERVASADAVPNAAEPVKCQWEAQPQDREKALKERKAQMILQARKYVASWLTQAHAATQNESGLGVRCRRFLCTTFREYIAPSPLVTTKRPLRLDQLRSAAVHRVRTLKDHVKSAYTTPSSSRMLCEARRRTACARCWSRCARAARSAPRSGQSAFRTARCAGDRTRSSPPCDRPAHRRGGLPGGT